jgi:hypothetical protein
MSKKSDLLAEMTPALRQCYKQISGLLFDADKNIIIARHKTGKIIQDILDTEDNSKFGKDAAGQLAVALAIPKQDLYRCKVFADTYADGDVKKLVTKTTAGGRRLKWSHVDLIIRIQDDKLRRKMLDRVFANDWSVRELSDAIKDKLGKRGKGKGRPRATPSTPQGAIALLAKQAKTVVDVYSASAKKLDEAVDMPGDFDSKVIKTELSEARPQVKAAIASLQKSLDQLYLIKSAVAKSAAARKNKDVFDEAIAARKKQKSKKIKIASKPKAKKLKVKKTFTLKK